MRDKVIDAAKTYLDVEGIVYGNVRRCEESETPKSFKAGKSWVVEFEPVDTGVRIDNDHVIVLVNSETLEATIFPTM